jgi:hypothetical protein
MFHQNTALFIKGEEHVQPIDGCFSWQKHVAVLNL